MVGMGADAFFNSPGLPVNQQDSELVSQYDGKPAQQQSSLPAIQQDSKLVKATFYISSGDQWKLELIKLQRLQRGEKVDKSALIREAIGLLASMEASQ